MLVGLAGPAVGFFWSGFPIHPIFTSTTVVVTVWLLVQGYRQIRRDGVERPGRWYPYWHVVRRRKR